MTQPFVVIEGPDGTGKSTLAEALVKDGFAYEHFGPPDRSAYHFYAAALDKHVDEPTAIDRFHVGSFVYGCLFRGMDDLEPYDHWMLEGQLMARNSIMVYANTARETIDKALSRGPTTADEELYEAPDMRAMVSDFYQSYMMGMTALPVMPYDFSTPDALPTIVKDIKQTLEYLQSAPQCVASVKPFGNVYSPQFCLVGASPSRYLFRTLVAARIKLNAVCIVPSLPEPFELSHFWLNTRFVALGRKADAQLDALGVAHRSVAHPGLVERAHYARINEYAKAIRGDGEFAIEVRQLSVKERADKLGLFIP